MEKFKLPSKAELQRAEAAKPGVGKEWIDLYFEVVRSEMQRELQEQLARLSYLRHIQRYRYFSVAAGCTLALASLGICAYGIHEKVDITPLAVVLGPLAGLAGVFIWGYRPGKLIE